jgi:hypothetical protein
MYEEMNELKYLKGSPIQIRDGLKIYPLTLGEIADLGLGNYYNYIQSLTIDKSMINKLDGIVPKSEIEEVYKYNELEFILYLCSKDTSIFYFFLESMKIFLRSEIGLFQDVGFVITNNEAEIILDNDLFLEIKKVIIKQNFLKDDDSSNFKPANSKAKELMEKLKKAKEKIQKQNNEEGLNLKDIISIVSNYSNDLNILTIWNLTVYQLYEAYLRLIVWDEYHNKYTLLPHTTDSQSLDLKHWAVDINKIK